MSKLVKGKIGLGEEKAIKSVLILMWGVEPICFQYDKLSAATRNAVTERRFNNILAWLGVEAPAKAPEAQASLFEFGAAKAHVKPEPVAEAAPGLDDDYNIIALLKALNTLLAAH